MSIQRTISDIFFMKRSERRICMDIKYIREFIKDESGVELIEWLAILGVVAGLIIIAAKVGEKVKSRLSHAASYI